MISLKYEARTGKAASLRKGKRVPVVLYGRVHKAEQGSIAELDFERAFSQAGESQIVSLEGPNGTEEALFHEVQFDAVTERPIHVDFYVVEKGRKVQVHVPITFIGIAAAEAELHGNIVKIMHEVEVEALPKDLPQHLDADLALLVDFQSQIHASDLKLPAGVELITAPEDVVATAEMAVEEDLSVPVTGPDLAAIEVSDEKGKEAVEAAEGAVAEGAAAPAAAPAPEKKSEKKTEKK